jgi:hypothetical protein
MYSNIIQDNLLKIKNIIDQILQQFFIQYFLKVG